MTWSGGRRYQKSGLRMPASAGGWAAMCVAFRGAVALDAASGGHSLSGNSPFRMQAFYFSLTCLRCLVSK